MAAKRNKVNYIILPHKNKHDLVGIEDVATDIEVIWVQHAQEVLEYVLLPHTREQNQSTMTATS